MKKKIIVIAFVLLLVIPLISAEKTIHLQSKEFKPEKKIDLNLTQKEVQTEKTTKKTLKKDAKTAETPKTKLSTEQTKKHILIQLNYIPTEEDKQDLTKKGIILLNYIPDYSWIVAISQEAMAQLENDDSIIYAGELAKEDKMLHSLNKRLQADPEPKIMETIRLKGKFFQDTTSDEMVATLSKYTSDYLLKENYFEINISKIDVENIASEDTVNWVSDLFLEPKTQNNIARQIISVNTIQASPYNLTGLGVVAAEWDGGWVGNHTDFGNRITIGDNGSTVDPHATHVAGTMIGAGIINSLYKGMAPNATLISYEWSNLTTEYNQAINTYNAVVSQNSWGYGPNITTINYCNLILGSYSDTYDNILMDNVTRGSFGKKMTIVFSAGNERSTNFDKCGSLGFTYNTTIPPATSKNTITVGAVDDNQVVASFSSWGPTDDGRIKPDVVANGVSVMSTIPVNTYTSYDGTSMAAPGVSGAAILLYEHYKSLHGNQNPGSELVKNIIIHTAKDLGNTGPDYQYGYGLVNATRAVQYISDDVNKTLFFGSNITQTGQNVTYKFELPQGKSDLKITLVWNDYPGAELASVELVNDLDLIVISPNSQRKYPWTLNASNPSANATQNREDHLNNVEQVYMQNPDAGVWTVIINGSVIPESPQEYSLITSTNDELAPRLNVTSPQNSTTYYDSNVNLNYVVSDLNLDSCWFTNTTSQNQTLTNCSNTTIQNLTTGNKNITVFANDTYGNTIFNTINFNIDVTPPTINFSSPINQTTNNLSLEINVSVVDQAHNISSCILEWNATNESMTKSAEGNNISCYKNKTVTGKGLFFYKVFANNSVDNTGVSSQAYVNITNTPPNITSFEPNVTVVSVAENSSIFFNHTSTDANNDTLLYNWTLNGITRSTNNSWLYEPNYTAAGNYNVTLFVNDGENTSLVSWNLTVLIDDVFPVVNITFPTNVSIVNNSYFTLVFNANETNPNTGTFCNYTLIKNSTTTNSNLNISIDEMTQVETVYSYNTSIVALENGNYTLTVECIDTNNQTSSLTYGFMLNDTVAPTVSSISASSSGTKPVTVTLSATTNEAATCKYSTSNVAYDSMSAMTTTRATSHSVANDYTVDTSGTYYVRCSDSAGNTMNTSSSTAFTADVITSGGGGGGGGGGYVPTTQTNASSTYSKSWDKLVIGVLQKVIINSTSYENISFTILEFKPTINITNPELKIVALLTPSSTTGAIKTKAYKYIQIVETNVNEGDLTNTRIEFKVEKSWLLNNSLTKEKITLFRYTNSSWISQQTVIILEDSKYVYYSAQTSGFSYFAIGEKEEVTQPAQPPATTPTTPTETPAEQPPATPPAQPPAIPPTQP
ncbi:MAG: S8 family serine peptidase, partial [Nanoarchaeota archaeon]|nr:S8 family serine peptidase [Nanoarchaeota archaeon]